MLRNIGKRWTMEKMLEVSCGIVGKLSISSVDIQWKRRAKHLKLIKNYFYTVYNNL